MTDTDTDDGILTRARLQEYERISQLAKTTAEESREWGIVNTLLMKEDDNNSLDETYNPNQVSEVYRRRLWRSVFC